MPIVVKHQAAGIAPSPENPRLKYGMAMVAQQQRADQEMRLRSQESQLAMQRMGAMNQMRQPQEPTFGEESMMLDQEIRGGMYAPETVKAIRDEQQQMRLIMRDRNLDATQRARALEQIQSRIRMARNTGLMQPNMMQQMPQQMGQVGQQQRKLSGRESFRADPKLEERFLAMVDQQAEAEGVVLPYRDRLKRALDLYDEREAALADPVQGTQPQQQMPQGQSPAMGGNAVPAGQPQASMSQPVSDRWGAQAFGVENVLATPASPPLAQPAQQSQVQYASQPQQQASSPQQNYAGSQSTVDNGWTQLPSNLTGGERSWTGLLPDGRPGTTVNGEMVRIRITPGGDPLTSEMVTIRRSDNGQEVDIPLHRLSKENQAFVVANPQWAYESQNQDMARSQQFFDPESPVGQSMRTPDPNIVNPQKQTLGSEYKGRYGLGGADYGINPATGNRVTASVRPGGTMLEYDPPGATEEQIASDNAAKQKQRDFNARMRANQSGQSVAGTASGNQTMVAGGAASQGGQMKPASPQDAPALTQLLATMTPTQRRDYSKWLMEEPDRYAMRNQIAQQQLNQTAAAAAGGGQLQKYPGLQQRMRERNQQQGQVPMQGQIPMQGQPGVSQPVGMSVEQAVAIARNPNASDVDQKKASEVMIRNGITSVDQAGKVIGQVSSPPVTDQGPVLSSSDPQYQDKRGAVSQYPYAETYEGSVRPPSPPPPTKPPVTDQGPVLDANNPRYQGNRGVTAPYPYAETYEGSVRPPSPAKPPVADQGPVLDANDPQYQGKRGATVPYPNADTYEGGVAAKDSSGAATSERGVPSEPEAVKVRKWTSADGKKTFDGSLSGFSYNNTDGRQVAVINSTDGQVFKIPIENFSEDDQVHLRAVSRIQNVTENQVRDFQPLGFDVGSGEKYSAPKTSSKPRPPKGKGRGTSTDPASKWPEEVIKSTPKQSARNARRMS